MLILTFFLGCRTQAAPSTPAPEQIPPPSSTTPIVSVQVPTDCDRYIADVTPKEIVIVCFDAGNGSHGRQIIKAPDGSYDMAITHTSPLASHP